MKLLACLLLLLTCLLVTAGGALADGGSLRAVHESGGLQISVFTAPQALTAGTADVSVLVQDAQTLEMIPDATVRVMLSPRELGFAAQSLEATRALATNKLLRSCHPALEAGWYDVVVDVVAGERHGKTDFAMLVGPPPTGVQGFWPWFTWPAVPIALVAAHLWWNARIASKAAKGNATRCVRPEAAKHASTR